MATEPETPSPDVMEVWREARAAYYSGPVTVHEASGSLLHIGSSGAAANIIAEAKARWEREAFEKAAQAAEGEAGVYTDDGEGDAWIALRIASAIRVLKGAS